MKQCIYCYWRKRVAPHPAEAQADRIAEPVAEDSTFGVGLVKFADPTTALRYLAKRLRQAGISSRVADDYAESIEFTLARRDDLAIDSEPVAEVRSDGVSRWTVWLDRPKLDAGTLLFTHPAQPGGEGRKPLSATTAVEVMSAWSADGGFEVAGPGPTFLRGWRAAEAFHGATPTPDAARDVLAERRRQVEVEGWSSRDDDEHDNGQMARAAACYAFPTKVVTFSREEGEKTTFPPPHGWPWDRRWWKPADQRRNLVKAGALILAEIERLDRAAMRADAPAPEDKP